MASVVPKARLLSYHQRRNLKRTQGMASVVLTRSLLTISSKMKSLRLKGNYTGLLPTTTSISISSPSGFSSDFNWRISRTAAMETKSKCFSIFSDDCPLNPSPSGVHDKIPTGLGTANKGTAFDDVGKANRKDPHQNAKRPSPEECIHTLNEMHLFETSDRLYRVACKIFRKSEAHRKQWMQLCQEQQQQQQEQEIVIKNWIESSMEELGFY